MTRALARVLAFFGYTRPDAARGLERTRTRLAAAHSAERAARARNRELRARLLEAERRLAESQARERRLIETYGSPRERLLALLPVRAEAARHAAEDAVAREARFEAASASYREAKRLWVQGGLATDAARAAIAGVSWAVPAAAGGLLAGRVRDQGWLPLDDLAIVRQYAVGGAMLDVGANIGTTSIPRVLLGDFACAYCAEPDPHNYACLASNVLDNHLAGRVLPDRVAIAATSGPMHLRRSAQIGGHKLVSAGTAVPGTAHEVAALTLDAWVERLGVAPHSVTFVKVDTQGWDLHVLEGATGLLRQRHIVWQIEVSPSMMAAAGRSVDELCALAGRHFTHVRELRSRTAARSQPVSRLRELLAPLRDRQFTNLLLHNRS